MTPLALDAVTDAGTVQLGTVVSPDRCTSSPHLGKLAELVDLEGWHLELTRYGTRCSACRGERVHAGSLRFARLVVERGAVVECLPCRDQLPVLVLELWPSRHGPPITCTCSPSIEHAAAVLLDHAHRLRYLRHLSEHRVD